MLTASPRDFTSILPKPHPGTLSPRISWRSSAKVIFHKARHPGRCKTGLPTEPIGAAWLVQIYGVIPLGRLPVISQIGGRRATQVDNGFRSEVYTEAMRPSAEPAVHLQFHLRHEVPHLEFLARLFERSGPDFVHAWVMAEPTGQYARRAAFLYEWLTGETLAVPERLGGNYIDAIDDAKLVATSPDRVVKVQRWRVNDNLPGTRRFCPMVVKTDAVNRAASLDVPRLFGELTAEFGEDLLMRAAVWPGASSTSSLKSASPVNMQCAW